MEVRLLSKSKDGMRASLIMKGFSPAYMNAIRRSVVNHVPTLAIEDVEIRKNNSILYDEMLAHRLGLVVFTTDLGSYELKESCSCKGEGCAKCTLSMTLKAKGPGYVYASDIKTKDPNIKPVYPKTPIVKLLKGQEVQAEMTGVLGQGKDHMKWSPGLAYYHFKPNIEVMKQGESCAEAVEACPKHVFILKNDKLTVDKDRLMGCDLCEACLEACEKGSIRVSADPETFIFTVESWGSLPAAEMLQQAMAYLSAELESFAGALK
ncbi:DNA-directed RNA polymerase subunit D [Candidatus Woesearchaeota archaeon]|nr:DNA-directed RNA polymerase subunit D [Candidatus Woesearchaeota archaeon]